MRPQYAMQRTDTFSDQQLKEYLFGSIPYRLQSLRLCYKICGVENQAKRECGVELAIGEAVDLDENRPLWINSVIESGLIYCRVLLEFLGITRDWKTDTLKQRDGAKYNPLNDDICITVFGLEKITVEQAVSGFSYARPDEISRALCNVIEIANKTVAHLTVGPTSAGTLTSLRLACRVVIDLVSRQVYVPLQGGRLLQDSLLKEPPVYPISATD